MMKSIKWNILDELEEVVVFFPLNIPEVDIRVETES